MSLVHLVVGKNADGSFITAPIAGTLQSDGTATLAPGTPAVEILTENLAFWLKKGTANSAFWPDASANARDMILHGEVSATADMVSFNGLSQYGVIPGSSGLGPGFSVYMKFRQNDWSAFSRIFGGASHLLQAPSIPNISLYDSDTAAYATNPGASIGQFVALAAIQNTAGLLLNINDEERTSSTAYDTMLSFALAGNSSGGSLSNIDVVEIIAYNTAHDSTQKVHMLAYLASL